LGIGYKKGYFDAKCNDKILPRKYQGILNPVALFFAMEGLLNTHYGLVLQ